MTTWLRRKPLPPRSNVRERRLIALLDGVDEGTFYELRALGREQYSIVSVLENVASHDHEHLEQIARTIASAGSNR